MAARKLTNPITGRGIIQMRARAGIDRIGRGTQERDAVIITEIPFQVNKARLIERIAELTNERSSKAFPTCATNRIVRACASSSN